MTANATAEDHFRRGHEDLDSGQLERALGHFRAAHRLDPGHPGYRSFFGLALGLVERRWERALELCRSAAREEFFDPVHYHNLARLHLSFGFKAEAVRLLHRGLLIDPENPEIAAELGQLGIRRRPPVAFLRRDHLLNRWLGRLLDRLALVRSGEWAATGA
jgi:tetratricopeptide (TPR) repeat protein